MVDRSPSVPDTDLVALLLDVRQDVRSGVASLHAKFDGLNGKLDAHARDDVTMEQRLRNEIGTVRDEHSKTAQVVARIVGEHEAEERIVGANGTGRFNVPPGTMTIPTPPVGMSAPGISINIGDHTRGSRHSSSPPSGWLAKTAGKIAQSTAAKLVGVAVSVGGAWAFGHFVTSPPTTAAGPPAMASAPPPAVPAPLPPQVPVETAVSTATTPLPDAGHHVR